MSDICGKCGIPKQEQQVTYFLNRDFTVPGQSSIIKRNVPYCSKCGSAPPAIQDLTREETRAFIYKGQLPAASAETPRQS